MTVRRAIRAPFIGAASALCLAASAGPARAQSAAIDPAALRARLFTIAADSMGGRDTGSRGNWLTAEYVAAEFRRFGLEPMGESGTYFQTIPFVHEHLDTNGVLTARGQRLEIGPDLIPIGGAVDWSAGNQAPVFGGMAGDSTTFPEAGLTQGRLVVLTMPAGEIRQAFANIGPTLGSARMRGASGFAFIALDRVAADLREQLLQGNYTTDPPAPAGAPPLFLVSARAARILLGADPATLAAGATGSPMAGGVRFRRDSLEWPARNVVAVLRGSDPALAGTYLSVTAHNDHVGYASRAVDHDSVFAHNRVVRPLGADSPDRPATPAEAARIRQVRDSLAAIRPSPRDSIFNGADDDGTGTVALLEIARALSSGPRPKRSILFVSHAAEERGLLGSQWFTDHPTVPRDSVVGEVDMDMIGRGDAQDLAEGGPAYLEVIGSRRLSREFGDRLEAVNARQPLPFRFNYEYDRPGHPLQYYCRADHYSYARWGIPAMALSRGEHADYHQVTDEPAFIDFDALSRVAGLVLDFAREIANLDTRPLVDGPRPDPYGPCRQ
jgi:hypothetical protein